MATSNNSTVPVINPFTGKPIIQRFLDDPELFALVCKEGGADMTEDELADMDAWVECRMHEDSQVTDEELEAALSPYYEAIAAAGK